VSGGLSQMQDTRRGCQIHGGRTHRLYSLIDPHVADGVLTLTAHGVTFTMRMDGRKLRAERNALTVIHCRPTEKGTDGSG